MKFQEIILALQKFWSEQGCILAQPYDVEKGAGTMNPSTFLILNLGTFEGHNGLTRNCKYFIIALSSLMIPLLDVVRLIIFRLKHHRNPFQADMNHVHHKLIQLGASPHQALMILLSADVILILANAYLSMYVNVNILLVADVVVYYLVLLILTNSIEKGKRFFFFS